jgi:hypothetical protein
LLRVRNDRSSIKKQKNWYGVTGFFQCFEMMRWLVEENKERWPYEYEYWQRHWAKP